MEYCCGFVQGVPNKHQLWCAKHPDRVKAKAPPEPPPPPVSNAPVIKSAADRVVMQCAALLEEDKWNTLTNHVIDIRGTKIWISNGANFVCLQTEASCDQLKDLAPNASVRTYFWDAYEGFLRREKERRAETIERQLAAKLAAERRPPIPAVAPPRRKFLGVF